MQRWQRIEELFLAASELPPAERASFVETQTAGDPDLRAAVSGMLLHAGESDARFHDAVERTAVSAAADTDLTLSRIDRYTIVRELGRGGMGTVYLAERSDQEFHQQVAIKVVKRGMDTAQIVERFRRERRMLAALDHPGIARFLDGGATSNGLPYLVMEFIEGRPLMEHCRERNLIIRDRLLLFEQVCAAVQHAHQKLIVHRDIKPANILVTPAGTPKLLDFGIAKLVLSDDEGEAAADTFTRLGMRMLTPDYASPEQIRGEPVSVATDVYSLGAVLYELLTGKRVHQFQAQTEAEFQRVICEVEAKLPSLAADDARVRGQLSGDLDNIVALALRKDPARRYLSVEQFAGDIRRFLDGHPVTARPETLFYRASKFVARHRVPVAAAMLAVVSLLAGIVGTAVQARRADAQAAKAERRFQQVRKLANSFVFDVYDGMADIPGTAKVRASVVATALEYLDSLAREAEGESALQLELAAAYKRIGDVQGNPARSGLGQMQAALSNYEKALGILRRLAAAPDPEPKVLTDLAVLERTLGYVRLSAGDAARAVEHQRRSIAAWERRNPRRGESLEVDTGVAQAWGILGKALFELGDSSEAVERHTAAVNLMRGWLPRQTVRTTRGTISIMLHDLAEARLDTGDLRGAVETYREAAQIRKEILAKDPSSLGYRRRLFALNFELAAALGHPLALSLGDYAGAESYAAEAFQEAERMFKEDAASNRSIRDRMWGNWILGCVLIPASPRRAIPYLEGALQWASVRPEGGASDVLQEQTEAEAREALGRARLAAGERARGLDLLRQALATFERNSAAAPQAIAYRVALIRAANALGDALPVSDAAEFYRKAFRAAALLPAEPRNVRELLSQAEVHLRWPRWNPAALAAERQQKAARALQLWQKLASYAPKNRRVQDTVAEAQRAAI